MKRLWMFLIIAIISIWSSTGLWSSTVFAQDSGAQLTVMEINASALPNVDMTLSASDGSGQLLDLNNELLIVKHGGERVTQASVIGSKPAGTFTIFLLDLPPGVEGQLSDIQSTIQNYASTNFMREQVDYMAIYRVDAVNSVELLAPTFFYNEVTNLFSAGLETYDGATALYDSVGDLLTNIDTLKPSPGLATSIVVMSDGTDAVSAQFAADSLAPLATSKNVQLHTVWLDNVNLQVARDAGRLYMTSLAGESGGIVTEMADINSLSAIWTRIVSRGENTIIRYVIDNLLPGTFDVEVSFPNLPALPFALTQVSVPASIPRVSINTQEPLYELSLPNLDELEQINLPVSVVWLDGTERTVTEAQLWLNGTPIQAIAPEELSTVSAELPLIYGGNLIQIVILDDTGQQSRSNEVILNVTEGERSVPAEIGNATLGIPSSIWWLVGICLLILLLLGLLRFLWPRLQDGRQRRERRVKSNDNSPRPQESSRVAAAVAPPAERKIPAPVEPPQHTPSRYAPPVGGGQPTLTSPKVVSIELLDARTEGNVFNAITRSEYLIGRSATVDLPLVDDPTVSRIHCTIVQDGDAYRIYDEQSTSGTYVNDREVPEYGMQLSDGDEIHLGAVHLRFRQP